MANRIISQMNNIKNNAPAIGSFYSKRYLQFGTNTPAQIQYASVNSINMYFRVGGYDLYDNRENNHEKVTALAGQITSSLAAIRQPFSYTLYGTSNGIDVFYGTSYECAGIIRNAISYNLNNAVVENIWIRQDELMKLQKFNTLIVGPKALPEGTIDRVISGLSGQEYLINFLCIPCSPQELTMEIGQLNDIRMMLERVSTFEWAYGNGRQRRMSSDDRNVADAAQIVDLERNRLNSALASGAWKVLIHVGAETKSCVEQVTASLMAAFTSSTMIEDTNTVGTIAVTQAVPVISRSVWEYPTSFLGTQDFGGLYSSSLLNIVEAEYLRSIVALPTQTHGAYNVRHMGDSSVGAGAFSSQAPLIRGNHILDLGLMAGGNTYRYSLDDFRQHAFVTGAPRYGKSTTVQKIIAEAHRNGVPFIVVEAAKKEYWELKMVPGLEGIRVYSSGRDTLPLKINPFQPEYNTQLEFHIQSLIHALLSMFDQEDPLPQILTELVYKCYEDRGWDTMTRVRGNEDLEYPCFDDMLNHLDEVIENIGYDEEIKQRMSGVVRIRIQSVIRQAGRAFNTKDNMSVEEMFRTSAVVELDDFADQLKPFVASVVALKVNEYTRQRRMSGQLKRLMVLEEAHNIMPNPASVGASRNVARCSDYFSGMLAEVSAYGTGIIVVEQRPSAIAPAAIANTSIKIVHNIHEGNDIDTIMSSLNLKAHAKAHLSTLLIGQAVVSFPQTDRICMVKIDGKKGFNPGVHLGCLFCNNATCQPVDFQISQYAKNTVVANGISRTSLQRCVLSAVDTMGRELRDLSHNEIMCIAGQICRRTSTKDDNPVVTRQHLYDLYTSIDGMHQI